jgi:hypothetical protein
LAGHTPAPAVCSIAAHRISTDKTELRIQSFDTELQSVLSLELNLRCIFGKYNSLVVCPFFLLGIRVVEFHA